MDDSEISAQAHFLLGARHSLTYVALVRDGLSRKATNVRTSRRRA